MKARFPNAHSNVRYAEIAIVKIGLDGRRTYVGTVRWHCNPLVRVWFAVEDKWKAVTARFKALFPSTKEKKHA